MCKYYANIGQIVQPEPIIGCPGIDDPAALELETIFEEMPSFVNLTPYKYNGGQLYIDPENGVNSPEIAKRYCINVDWFSATLRGLFLDFNEYGDPNPVVVRDHGEIGLERDLERAGGTKHYKFVYKVYIQGELFGEILTIPRNTAILDGDLSQIKIENHCLYTSDWFEKFTYLCKNLGLVLNNITRLDIALDGHGFLNFHQDYEYGLYEKLGKATLCTYWSGNRVMTGFDVGRKSSSKHLTCYNRSKRIKSDNKTFLYKYWKQNDLDISQDVERLELKLKSKAIKQIENFDPQRLTDPVYLASIMQLHLKNYYEFTEASSDQNVSRRKKIQPVDWSAIKTERIEKAKEVKAPNVLWALKRRITFDMQEFYAKCDTGVNSLFDQVHTRNWELAKLYGVGDWFLVKMKHWEKQKKVHDAIRAQRKAVNYRSHFVNN